MLSNKKKFGDAKSKLLGFQGIREKSEHSYVQIFRTFLAQIFPNLRIVLHNAFDSIFHRVSLLRYEADTKGESDCGSRHFIIRLGS